MKPALLKHSLLLLVSLLLSAPFADAQWLIGRRQWERMQAENRMLHARVDSLMAVLDSLQASRQRSDKLEAMLEGNDVPSRGEEAVDYSPQITDSLLTLWYKQNFAADLSPLPEYDMDRVSFSSNVSDAALMQRLADMNPFFTLPFNETVKNYMVLYAEKMPEQMGRVLGLSAYYFPIFEETFVRYGLPVELKYMAVVESMLKPLATSRAGARGVWQFMYTTARAYGLRIDSYVDERLDVEKAVDAAARYLRDAYRIFGDWPLAISAYNCGAGNVKKAITAAGKTDFWSVYDYLPRETRGYVPAFVGAMYAMTYSREYGLVPAEVGMPAATDTFIVRRNLHFKQVSEVAGVPMEDLKNLNPQYYNDIIPGAGGPCVLRIPYRWTSAFVDAHTDSLYAYKASEYLSAQVLKGIENGANPHRRTAYRVKSGDYLGRIAARHHVSVAQIKKWNHLRSDRLRIGQVLYIYR